MRFFAGSETRKVKIQKKKIEEEKTLAQAGHMSPRPTKFLEIHQKVLHPVVFLLVFH